MNPADDPKVALRALPLISELSPELGERAIDLLLANSETVAIAPDVEIFREGEAEPNEGIVLLSGSVIIEKSYGPSSTEVAPALLGEVKQFDPKSERTATVRAREDLKILRFSWDNVNRAIETSLDEEDSKRFRKALLDHAWKHNLS